MKKAQSHWKVFIEKQFIVHIEFVKAKEIEEYAKYTLFCEIHIFSNFCVQECQAAFYPQKQISLFTVKSLKFRGFNI